MNDLNPRPFTTWKPTPEGERWVHVPRSPFFQTLEDGLEQLRWGRRDAREGEDYWVGWSEQEGYRALARSADRAPKPAELLQGELGAFLEGEFDLRPTLLGGPPD